MNEAQEVRDLLLRIIGEKAETTILVAEVTKVDKNNNTCSIDPQNDDSDTVIEGVQLCPDYATTDFVMYPKIGSLVIVTKSRRSGWYVSMFSELDEVIYFKGINDGMVKITPLVAKIKALEDQFNTILNILETTVIPLAPAGTYPFAPLYASVNPIAPVTQKSDLENTKIKH